MKERTLVLIKPEGVQRHLVGKIITRFEDAGFKIAGMKLIWVQKEFAGKHYGEDIEKRRGKEVREMLLNHISASPVVAIVLQGNKVVENVRKMVGATEPKSALPGTIRGDFSHISYEYADTNKSPVKNVIHASANVEEAEQEIRLWFSMEELYDYKTIQDFFN